MTEEELERYARHIVLKDVGGAGQARLGRARVLVVGAGGLGSPLLLYLAAAGVGTIGIVDDDHVSLSNLQRQIVHDTPSVGQRKVESAAARLAAVNPHPRIVPHPLRIDASNVMALLDDYDIVADGSDNFATRFLLADACHLAGKTLVSGAILQFDGQLSVFKSHLGAPHPCYRCLFPAPPPPDLEPTCSSAGVLGAVAGVIGSLQAVEVIKEILGIGESLSGKLLIYDALATAFRRVTLRRDPTCALCGEAASINDLSAHAR